MSEQRGPFRGLYTRLFDDEDYQRLSPIARLTLLTTRLCPQAGPGAIFQYHPVVLSEQTGLKPEELETALVELATTPTSEAPWIFREGRIVWVRNGLRFDPGRSLEHVDHRKGIARALDALPKRSIVERFRTTYGFLVEPAGSQRGASAEPAESQRGASQQPVPSEGSGTRQGSGRRTHGSAEPARSQSAGSTQPVPSSNGKTRSRGNDESWKGQEGGEVTRL